MKTLYALLKYIMLSRAAVPTIGIAAFVALALIVPSVVQATDRLIKITTLEPETERDGTCDPPTLEGGIPLALLPPELIGLRGYTQGCEEGMGSGAEGDGDDLWEFATNRWSIGTATVNKGDKVTLEFHGIRGRTHTTQIFRPGYEIVIRDDGLQGVSGPGAGRCKFTDTGLQVPETPAGQKCFFAIPRGEVVRVSLNANKVGAWLIHCHTHGTSMNADLIVVDNDD